jgi:glycosyltransferase involved in cell wall biosynthesis
MRETAGMRTAKQTRAQSFAYAFAHHIIANSEAVRQRLVQKGIRADRITVIYNGLDMNRLRTQLERTEALTQLGLPAEEKGCRQEFVTIIANMRHEVKDYPTFLRAAQRIKAAIPDAAFLLAGEGGLADSIRSLAKDLDLESSTFFLGRCDKIAELLSVSEACVLSSKAEGFSNSILEYMAAGRPVVATDVGGAKEAIVEGITGYLVQSGDDKTMAERIIILLKEPERALTMGRLGRKLVEEKFSCTAQLRRTEELYDQLLRK